MQVRGFQVILQSRADSAIKHVKVILPHLSRLLLRQQCLHDANAILHKLHDCLWYQSMIITLAFGHGAAYQVIVFLVKIHGRGVLITLSLDLLFNTLPQVFRCDFLQLAEYLVLLLNEPEGNFPCIFWTQK